MASTIRFCRFGPTCFNNDCPFSHDPKDYQAYVNKVSKTKACKLGRGCQFAQCTFAHNLNEFRVVDCPYKDKCDRVECINKHSEKDTKNALWIRSIYNESEHPSVLYPDETAPKCGKITYAKIVQTETTMTKRPSSPVMQRNSPKVSEKNSLNGPFRPLNPTKSEKLEKSQEPKKDESPPQQQHVRKTSFEEWGVVEDDEEESNEDSVVSKNTTEKSTETFTLKIDPPRSPSAPKRKLTLDLPRGREIQQDIEIFMEESRVKPTQVSTKNKYKLIFETGDDITSVLSNMNKLKTLKLITISVHE